MPSLQNNDSFVSVVASSPAAVLGKLFCNILPTEVGFLHLFNFALASSIVWLLLAAMFKCFSMFYQLNKVSPLAPPFDTDDKPFDLDEFLSAISVKTLISGFRSYCHCLALLITLRRRFAKNVICPNEHRAFKRALSIFAYGMGLCYLELAPFIYAFSWNMDKSLFFLQNVYCVVIPILWHPILKCIGGKGSLEGTLAMQCMWAGLTLPIFTLAGIPFWYYLRSYNLYPYYASINDIPLAIGVYSVILLIAYYGLYANALYAWIADIHQIGFIRFVISGLILGIILRAIKPLEPYVSSVLNFASGVWQKIT